MPVKKFIFNQTFLIRIKNFIPGLIKNFKFLLMNKIQNGRWALQKKPLQTSKSVLNRRSGNLSTQFDQRY